jgi:S-adenosylmethionine hydrolase
VFDTITLLTDFGLEDDFVGVCHGVIARIAPNAKVIDITHGIQAQAVVQGALALARSLPFMPAGVHVAVVDPGVGSARRAVAIATEDGRVLIGPDNGLLIPAAEQLGITGAVALTNARYHLSPVSRTFHARDIFSPAAAHLAVGVPLFELGDALPVASLVQLELPAATQTAGRIEATVTDVDRFGNLGLNATRHDLRSAGLGESEVLVESGGFSARVPFATAFADVALGEVLLLEDSYGALALAVNGGSARERCGVALGDAVSIAGL